MIVPFGVVSNEVIQYFHEWCLKLHWKFEKLLCNVIISCEEASSSTNLAQTNTRKIIPQEKTHRATVAPPSCLMLFQQAFNNIWKPTHTYNHHSKTLATFENTYTQPLFQACSKHLKTTTHKKKIFKRKKKENKEKENEINKKNK